MGIGGSGKQEVTIVLKFQAQVDCDDIDQDKVLGWETAVVELGMLDTKSLNPQNADPHPVVILKKSLSLSHGLLFASKTYKNSWVLCR